MLNTTKSAVGFASHLVLVNSFVCTHVQMRLKAQIYIRRESHSRTLNSLSKCDFDMSAFTHEQFELMQRYSFVIVKISEYFNLLQWDLIPL